MATIYRCDKCNNEDTKPLFNVNIPIISRYDRSGYIERSDYNKKSYDLCSNCMIELNEHLKPIPKEAKA